MEQSSAESEALPDGLKRIRKGTKSCVECRQRKIRCLWRDETDAVCTSCRQRGRPCVPQRYTRRTTNPAKVSSRDRIARLEAQLANITAAVQHRAQSSPLAPAGASHDDAAEAYEDRDSSDVEDPSMTLAPQPPEHLRLLFDNALIGPDERSRASDSRPKEQPVCSARYLDHARAKLRKLVPTRDDVAALSSFAVPWMSLYFELWPSTATTASRDALVNTHDDMLTSDADPVAMASYLLSFAMTVRQVPVGERQVLLKGWRDVDGYVKNVMATIENVILSHTGISSTVEGLSVNVLFLRLQFGCGQIKTLWLTLRRIVALAELSGLPHAWHSAQKANRDHIREAVSHPTTDNRTSKEALWETICATDRLASMMFNLPTATASHKFPRKQLTNADGSVRTQPYMFELAGIAMGLSEIDEGYVRGRPVPEVYGKVLAADSELRALKSATPRNWWRETDEYISATTLVQFWHCYLTARIHLHTAMIQDEHNQYAYSRTQCLDSCHALARRYGCLRRALPAGFFVCRIVDMQVFTAAVYLLLSSSDCNNLPIDEEQSRLQSVEQIMVTLEFVSGQDASDFAREAAAALKGLIAHLSKPAASDDPGMTLHVPLLGNIHVSRRAPSPPSVPMDRSAAPSSMPSELPQLTQPALGASYSAACYAPWMELDVTGPFQVPFFMEDPSYFDQWANMTGVTPVFSDMDIYEQTARHG